jgi:hypothetical protein
VVRSRLLISSSALFDVSFDLFFSVAGSYITALQQARNQDKLLFVYLHCDTHEDTPTFIRSTAKKILLVFCLYCPSLLLPFFCFFGSSSQTFCTEAIKDFLNVNFVTWMGNIKHTGPSLHVLPSSPFV